MTKTSTNVRLVGVDGCKKQWLAVTQDMDGVISASIHATPEKLLAEFPVAEVFAVDVPIGLMGCGRRQCDSEARNLLRAPRCHSVFYTPVRQVLQADVWKEANQISREVDGRGVSKQAYAILPYIKNWDELLRGGEEVRQKVYEVHPEVSFFAMNNSLPMQYSKKRALGAEERRGLLCNEFGEALVDSAQASLPKGCFSKDDFHDAFAALWSARRIAAKQAQQLPPNPPTDEHGLVMSIYY